MKKANSLVLCLTVFVLPLFAQDTLHTSIIKKMGFREYAVKSGGDTVYFYAYAKDATPKNNLVLFAGGSTPDPLFTYEIKDGKPQSYFWGHTDYRLLPANYLYVVIAKKGMHGVFNEAGLDTHKPPAIYLQKNSLDYRVWQTDEVLNYCHKHLLAKPEKIIVYGHSEGFNVVAKLLTVNKKVTHAGLWAGSAMPDYFDFMLFNQKQYLKGEISDSTCAAQNDTLLTDYRKVFTAPLDVNSSGMYTNKRWSSYAEPSVNHLLKTNIPLYMVVATKDGNAPVESSFIVPLEFMRLGKKKLTYKTCVGCDHGFSVTDSAGNRTAYWQKIFAEFIAWTDVKR